VPIIPVIFHRTLNCFNRFLKNTQISNLTKIHPVGAVLLHEDDIWLHRRCLQVKWKGS